MAQNGRTRGGTFHGEMDRCRENQGWTTACSDMPERDGKNQEDKTRLNKASGLVLVRSPMLTSHKWREHVCILRAFGLQMPWRFFSGVTFVLFCFVFCLYHIYAVVEAGARRSIVLRYAGVPIATRVSFFLFIWRCRFFEYFFRFIFVIGEYVVRSFLPDDIFSTL